MAKRTAAGIQADIAKGAFRPHTALSNVALAYYQSDANSFAKTVFPICPVTLSRLNLELVSGVNSGTGNRHTARLTRRCFPSIQTLMPAW